MVFGQTQFIELYRIHVAICYPFAGLWRSEIIIETKTSCALQQAGKGVSFALRTCDGLRLLSTVREN